MAGPEIIVASIPFLVIGWLVVSFLKDAPPESTSKDNEVERLEKENTQLKKQISQIESKLNQIEKQSQRQEDTTDSNQEQKSVDDRIDNIVEELDDPEI